MAWAIAGIAGSMSKNAMSDILIRESVTAVRRPAIGCGNYSMDITMDSSFLTGDER
jgi:hypothetical protein